MDDSSWIALSQSSLEHILADIINLQFGSSIVTICLAHHTKSVRYLGVWDNLARAHRFVIAQAKDEVLSLYSKLRSKRVTDKQLLYLFNIVIIPM
ncbi:hypothetical protein RclHR1_26360001 [Rhizophagus clarus]|uniref:Uncharacterized protein n=1 Tax=Rhizophagus clarus TaxID=94130 RepID=A0A2Z6RV70_9GLOM|nr:hypothetical protein RclHR1_26360001 [Rhizophagus clarus]GES99186.1 hypothetical protein RCL_jg9300.t1 [Rhizophagus clarus]